MFEQYPDVMTKEMLAEALHCKPSSIYEATRERSQVRSAHPLPVMRLPFGLRFKKTDIIEWLSKVASERIQDAGTF